MPMTDAVHTLDLTLPVEQPEPQSPAPGPGVSATPRMVDPVIRREWAPIPDGREQVARVFYFNHWSMSGTYLDFPGHLADTDDGTDAENCPLDKLYRVPATLARLNRAADSGGISAEELAAACATPPRGGAMVLNALGVKRFDEVGHRSVWLTRDAARWLVDTGIHLLISDVYEGNAEYQAVFYMLFAGGVSTVCRPINLHRVRGDALRVTVLPLRMAGVTQTPCRVVAEWLDANAGGGT